MSGELSTKDVDEDDLMRLAHEIEARYFGVRLRSLEVSRDRMRLFCALCRRPVMRDLFGAEINPKTEAEKAKLLIEEESVLAGKKPLLLMTMSGAVELWVSDDLSHASPITIVNR